MKQSRELTELLNHSDHYAIVWALTLESDSWKWRAATRSIDFQGEHYPARLVSINSWREMMTDVIPPGGCIERRTIVSILSQSTEKNSFTQNPDPIQVLFREHPGEWIKAELRLFFMDSTRIPKLESSCMMLRGRMIQWEETADHLNLALIDELSFAGRRRVIRRLSKQWLSEIPDVSNTLPAPWIFGNIDDAEAILVESGPVSLLRASINETDSIIPATNVENFPNSGKIQINGETISYTAVDFFNKTIGTSSSPVRRSTSSKKHHIADTIRYLPDTGFYWLVSDHPCKSIESVSADGVQLSASQWTAAVRVFNGIKTQCIHMNSWPTGSQETAAKRISVCVQGLADSHGNLIDHPVDIIKTLLEHSQLGNINSNLIDTDSFDHSRNQLDEYQYKFCRRINSDFTLSELLRQALQECHAYIDFNEKIRLFLMGVSPKPKDVVSIFDETTRLTPLNPIKITTPYTQGAMVRSIEWIRHGASNSSQMQFTYPIGGQLQTPKRISSYWIDLSSISAIKDLSSTTLSRLGDATFEFVEERTIASALFSIGDVVRINISHQRTLEKNIFAWIKKLELLGNSRVRLTLQGVWAGYYIWNDDEGNSLSENGSNVTLAHEGDPVFRFEDDGSLRIEGKLREYTPLTQTFEQGPIVSHGGWIYFCFGGGTQWKSFMRVNGEGDIELDGCLREFSSPASFSFNDERFGANQSWFWLYASSYVADSSFNGNMIFDVLEKRLYLSGMLIESFSKS